MIFFYFFDFCELKVCYLVIKCLISHIEIIM